MGLGGHGSGPGAGGAEPEAWARGLDHGAWAGRRGLRFWLQQGSPKTRVRDKWPEALGFGPGPRVTGHGPSARAPGPWALGPGRWNPSPGPWSRVPGPRSCWPQVPGFGPQAPGPGLTTATTASPWDISRGVPKKGEDSPGSPREQTRPDPDQTQTQTRQDKQDRQDRQDEKTDRQTRPDQTRRDGTGQGRARQDRQTEAPQRAQKNKNQKAIGKPKKGPEAPQTA